MLDPRESHESLDFLPQIFHHYKEEDRWYQSRLTSIELCSGVSSAGLLMVDEESCCSDVEVASGANGGEQGLEFAFIFRTLFPPGQAQAGGGSRCFTKFSSRVSFALISSSRGQMPPKSIPWESVHFRASDEEAILRASSSWTITGREFSISDFTASILSAKYSRTTNSIDAHA